MSRIVGGEFGGRRLTLPADPRVRPTGDRVREAWASIVGPRLPGATVLDLFAGSGALGLEALSRGAASATFVDVGARSIAAIRANLKALGLDGRARVVKQDVFRFLESVATPFDVAFADPPWGLGMAARVVERWRAAPFARLLGLEHPATESHPGGDSRRWGDTAVTFFEAE